MKNYIYLVFILLNTSVFAADFDVPQGFAKAYDEAFRLETKSAKISAASLPENNPFRIYLDNYIEFTELFNADSEAFFNQVSGNESKRLKRIENLESNSPYDKFLQAEILLQWAILKLKFGREAKGAYTVIQAAKLLNVNQKEYPEFLPTYKSLGSLHVIIGSVPDNYKWALKLLGLKGSVNEGFGELAKASKDKIWGNEAQYSSFFLKAFTARFSEQDNTALLRYINSRPTDLNAHFLGASVSLRTQRAEQSLKILNQKPTDGNYQTLTIFDLHYGDSFLAKGDYLKATNSYNRFLKNTKGKAYLKDTNLKLYFTYLLEGKPELALTHLQKIPVVGNANSDFDKTAQKYHSIIIKSKPDRNLIKAKVLLDGGYFNQGLAVLKATKNTSLGTEWQAEHDYLNGVAHVYGGDSAEAIEHLKRAISAAEKADWGSISANASLYLGYAYQLKKQTTQAKTYFEKALTYKNHEQKNTVDTKARAALSEIKTVL
jgi:tetratricopeptide (TPR) repeat protein